MGVLVVNPENMGRKMKLVLGWLARYEPIFTMLYRVAVLGFLALILMQLKGIEASIPYGTDLSVLEQSVHRIEQKIKPPEGIDAGIIPPRSGYYDGWPP